MDRIERGIEFLMQGKGVEDLTGHCDLLVMEDGKSKQFKPLVKKSLAYIVCAVLINEHGDVLMMQEAKKECSGQWYLPAGRMEKGEQIEDGWRREVHEETGLIAEPTTFLSIETSQATWIRFTLLGRVLGGSLKTPAQADSESLQAQWVSDIHSLPLRHKDVLPIIDRAKNYYLRSSAEPWHKNILPFKRPYEKMYLRTVVVIKKKENNRAHVLVSEKNRSTAHLPVCEIHPNKSIHSTLHTFMQDIFGFDTPTHKPHGALAFEHDGYPPHEHDGFCLTLLISVRVPLEEVGLSNSYSWLELGEAVGAALLERLGKNLSVALMVLH